VTVGGLVAAAAGLATMGLFAEQARRNRRDGRWSVRWLVAGVVIGYAVFAVILIATD
jgi:hypothetical protein